MKDYWGPICIIMCFLCVCGRGVTLFTHVQCSVYCSLGPNQQKVPEFSPVAANP